MLLKAQIYLYREIVPLYQNIEFISFVGLVKFSEYL